MESKEVSFLHDLHPAATSQSDPEWMKQSFHFVLTEWLIQTLDIYSLDLDPWHEHILHPKGSLTQRHRHTFSPSHTFLHVEEQNRSAPECPPFSSQTPAESSQTFLLSQSMIFPRESPRLGRCRITSVLITSIPLTTGIQCNRFRSLALGGLLAVTFTIRRLWFSPTRLFPLCTFSSSYGYHISWPISIFMSKRIQLESSQESVLAQLEWHQYSSILCHQICGMRTGKYAEKISSLQLDGDIIYQNHEERRVIMCCIIAKKEENKNLT